MSNPVVLLDCDGILADFMTAVLSEVTVFTGRRYTPEMVTGPDLFAALGPEEKSLEPEVTRIMARPGWCANILAYPDAARGVDALEKAGADIVVVTTPHRAVPTWAHEREEWLRRHMGLTRVIHTKYKSYVQGDILIDDSIEHCDAYLVPNCTYATPMLFDRPWNKSDTTHTRVTSLEEVAEMITRRTPRRVG